MGNSTKAKHYSFSKHIDWNLLKHQAQAMMNNKNQEQGEPIEQFGEILLSSIELVVDKLEKSEWVDVPNQWFKQLMVTLDKLEEKIASQEFWESSSEVIQRMERILSSCLERVEDWEDCSCERFNRCKMHKCSLIKYKLKIINDNFSEHLFKEKLKEANTKLDQL